MHPADQNEIRPCEIGPTRTSEILVNEPNRPSRWEIRRDYQEPLRRHESAHPRQKAISMGKRAKRWSVGRENAKNVASIRSRQGIMHAPSHLTRAKQLHLLYR